MPFPTAELHLRTLPPRGTHGKVILCVPYMYMFIDEYPLLNPSLLPLPPALPNQRPYLHVLGASVRSISREVA